MGVLGVTSLSSCDSPATKKKTTSSTSSTGSGTGGMGGSASIGINGGTADSLLFAIVGDTRPVNYNATSSYPTAVITKIWQDVEAVSPRPPFAIGTGDYQYSSTFGTVAGTQMDLYMGARANYTGLFFPVMGNHECTGYTASNCGSGNADGITKNYTAFVSTLLAPINQSLPYYSIRFDAPDGSYTAKLVVIAANAWDSTQASWLDGALSQPTTYTFVMRHEDRTANTAPGVTPSETIIKKYPLTMRIVGHTHTYHHYASDLEVVCGNGGAPLTSGTNYGYGVVERLADGNVQFTEYDYQSSSVIDQFRVKPDGAAAP